MKGVYYKYNNSLWKCVYWGVYSYINMLIVINVQYVLDIFVLLRGKYNRMR